MAFLIEKTYTLKEINLLAKEFSLTLGDESEDKDEFYISTRTLNYLDEFLDWLKCKEENRTPKDLNKWKN